jgi:cytochrome c-type biogenesis protein CcmH
MFWIVVAVLTAFVALVLISPLRRKPDDRIGEQPNEIAVYQDQLKELDRERESGLIGDVEADYARAEIGRRLIAAADAQQTMQAPANLARVNTWTARAVLAAIPAVGLCLYIFLGNPERPDMPLEARLENPGDNIELILAKIERHLAQNPDDSRGWDVVAPVYFTVGRWDDAQNAFRNAIRLDGENIARLTGLGETLVNSNDGIVIEEARSLFQRILMVEPSNPRAQFYNGLAAEQSGRMADAKRIYQDLADSSAADASWMPLVRQHLARIDSAAGEAPNVASTPAAPKGPTSADVEAASSMTEGDRQSMIQGMVEGLEARLVDNPDNIDGWLQLLRSYAVLGDKDKASSALAHALKTFAPDSDQGKRLIELARSQGITSSGGAL